eukprot:TRINITY_DN59020_c0_g1_i11.p1 TRINITY_DN59020_c0_g1~~TRINITY_DN59020_c0_g1_i11.p1  ORF type:complete len:169 (-),score=19.87 TRINITY_DN59020_c0_g1_i11:103-588(-)
MSWYMSTSSICYMQSHNLKSSKMLQSGLSTMSSCDDVVVGGSELERWAPPSDNQKDGGDLFASAVHRVREGLASSPGCRLSGVLWHQGESDSGSADLASTYRQRLVETLRGLATEGGWPDVPVVIGELAVHFLDMQNDARFAFAERVNTAIMAAATDMSPL